VASWRSARRRAEDSVALPCEVFRESGDGKFLFDAEFFDAFAEGGAGDAEEFGGLNLVAAGFGEGGDDEFAFDGRNDFAFGILARPTEEGFGDGGDFGEIGGGSRGSY